jgi:hypothetical protein
MALITCSSAGLKTQVLIMSPDSEDVQFKVNSLEEGLNGRHKDTEGQGIIG